MCTPNIFTWSGMKYCFDLDGTICNTPLRPSDNKPGYLESTPIPFMVDQVTVSYTHLTLPTKRIV